MRAVYEQVFYLVNPFVAEDHAGVRGFFFGTLVCGGSWLALALGAGNVGLQRSVSESPWRLLAEHPLAVPLLVGSAFLLSILLASRVLRVTPLEALIWVLLGDLVGSVVLAPILIGELEVIHAPIVFATISFFGLQIAAAALGAGLAWAFRASAATDP